MPYPVWDSAAQIKKNPRRNSERRTVLVGPTFHHWPMQECRAFCGTTESSPG